MYPADIVAEFIKTCRKYGIMPGFYYCSWDNHHLYGSLTPTLTSWNGAFTTEEYQRFQTAQIEELLTRYGPIGEVWIDIPKVLPRGYRHVLYNQIAELQPDAVIMMNHGIGDGSSFNIADTWPTDLIAIERFLPNSHTGHAPWRTIESNAYYMPGEVCGPIAREWFYVEGDMPRCDEELLGMYLVARSRKANLLLNVGPDKRGKIPEYFVNALMRLKDNISKVSSGI